MRYRLRTLLIVLVLGPPVLVGAYLLSIGPALWLFAHDYLSADAVNNYAQ